MTQVARMLAALSLVAGMALAGQAAAGSRSCGGPSNAQCSAGHYCNKAPDACHTPAAKGACEETPQICNELYQPVCGCDGVTYANACHAAMKGVSVASPGACPAPPSAPGAGS